MSERSAALSRVLAETVHEQVPPGGQQLWIQSDRLLQGTLRILPVVPEKDSDMVQTIPQQEPAGPVIRVAPRYLPVSFQFQGERVVYAPPCEQQALALWKPMAVG